MALTSLGDSCTEDFCSRRRILTASTCTFATSARFKCWTTTSSITQEARSMLQIWKVSKLLTTKKNKKKTGRSTLTGRSLLNKVVSKHWYYYFYCNLIIQNCFIRVTTSCRRTWTACSTWFWGHSENCSTLSINVGCVRRCSPYWYNKLRILFKMKTLRASVYELDCMISKMNYY